ncbi:MAG: hypothetical protein AAF354_14915 [Pseudomonadota bacterium]
MADTITIVWCDWMPDATEAKYRREGTMPDGYETEVSAACDGDGCWAAEMVAREANARDCEYFGESGDQMIILEPQWAAGRYDIYVDYQPVHSAGRVDPTTAAG